MEEKKVVVVKGSPRKRGNSATLAKEVISGAETAGAKVESFYLQGMDIRACIACDECREDTAFECVMDDDMKNYRS